MVVAFWNFLHSESNVDDDQTRMLSPNSFCTFIFKTSGKKILNSFVCLVVEDFWTYAVYSVSLNFLCVQVKFFFTPSALTLLAFLRIFYYFDLRTFINDRLYFNDRIIKNTDFEKLEWVMLLVKLLQDLGNRISAKPISSNFPKHFKSLFCYLGKRKDCIICLKKLFNDDLLIGLFWFLCNFRIKIVIDWNKCSVSKHHLPASNHASPTLICDQNFLLVCLFADGLDLNVFSICKEKDSLELFKKLILIQNIEWFALH